MILKTNVIFKKYCPNSCEPLTKRKRWQRICLIIFCLQANAVLSLLYLYILLHPRGTPTQLLFSPNSDMS